MTTLAPGRIAVPDDLDSVTDVGTESSDQRQAAEQVWRAVRHWYQAGTQPAIQVCVRRGGEVILDRAIGHGWGNGPDDPADAEKLTVTTQTPFCVYSAAKAISVTVLHLLIERGDLALDARVCDYLPDYTSHGKHRTTIDHVLTHSAGVPIALGVRPDLRRSEDSEYTRQMLAALRPVYRPGLLHMYHALTWGPLVREIVSAATGRSIRDILADDILDPLGFSWTNYGVAPGDVDKVAPSYVTGPPPPAAIEAAFTRVVGGTMAKTIQRSNTPAFLTGVVPSSNTVSTAFELSRFAELLRRGGELNGVRVLSAPTLDAARRQRRRLRPDIATGGRPLRWGTGYMLGSTNYGPFGRNAPEAFGHTGLTDIAMWADPQRELAVAVVSSGKPGSHPEAKRYPAVLDAINSAFPPTSV
ncbi:serine hydrolase [Gordonia effusa]|uniref:serine hydrolase n=1 Tax=Gordonia effusa TaxID=263908 RepID=UPI00058F18B4|nr:serine hydrolase [Gordonia effusa]